METQIIDYFIKEKHVTETVAKILSKSLLKYADIAREFSLWLENREYPSEENLIVGGYSAMDIHEIAPHLDAAGVYNFLVTMRDDPNKANSIIEKGFPTK